MGTIAKAFSFTIRTTDALNTTGSVTLGFEPKALYLFWNGRSDASNAVGRATSFRGVGFCAGTADRRCGNVSSRDAMPGGGTTVVRHQIDAIVCIGRSTGLANPSENGRVDLQSFDSNGFTWIIDEVFDLADITVFGFAVGGPTITAKTGTFAEPGSAIGREITGVGFRPTILFTMMMGQRGTDISDEDGHTTFNIGAAMGGGYEQFALSTMSVDAVTTTITTRYFKGGECIGFSDGTTMVYRDQFGAFTSDGFLMNCLESVSGRLTDYLAISGGHWQVGVLQTKTTLSDIAVTGLPMRPQAILFASHCKAESTQDTLDAEDACSMGIWDESTYQKAVGSLDENGKTTSEVSLAIRHAAVYASITAASAIDGVMSVKSVQDNGFVCEMDDAEAAASIVGYVAVGEPAPAKGERLDLEFTESEDEGRFDDLDVRNWWRNSLVPA